jgi:hypothetical protein
MSVNLSPLFNAVAQTTTTGLPLNGGLLYTYQAGSSTPLATYTTSSGSTANTNPIVLGTDGRPPQEIWLTDGSSYKFVLSDSSNNQIASYDNIYGILNVVGSNLNVVGNATVSGTLGVTGALTAPGVITQIVQQTFTTTASTTSNSLVTTGHTATITPSSLNSKILALVSFGADSSTGNFSGFTLYRNTTNLAGSGSVFTTMGSISGGETIATNSFSYLDTPNSTASTTYTVYMAAGGGTLTYNKNLSNIGLGATATITLLEIYES